MYDKEGLGYITTDTLRGLISELLAPLTDEELEGILEVTKTYICSLFAHFVTIIVFFFLLTAPNLGAKM